MVSLVLLGTGAALLLLGGYGLRYPQRQYAIRQWGQTTDDPTLSARGTLLWRVLDAVLVALGVWAVYLAATV